MGHTSNCVGMFVARFEKRNTFSRMKTAPHIFLLITMPPPTEAHAPCRIPGPYPKPESRIPRPQTRNPKPETRNPKPEPETRNLNPKPEASHPRTPRGTEHAPPLSPPLSFPLFPQFLPLAVSPPQSHARCQDVTIMCPLLIDSGLAGEVSRGEKMLYSGTDPESYITEYTLV